MKDKLVKNHHKGIYYKARRFGLAASISLGVLVLVGVPTYISLTSSIKTTIAQGNNDDPEEEKKDTPEEDSGLDENQMLSYYDAE